MMKIRFIGFIAMLFTAAVLTSCGGDDDGGAVIPPPSGGSDDGLFITGTATAAEPSADLELAEGFLDDFGQTPPFKTRAGYFEAYVYMEAGEFNITEIKDDGDTEVSWGGTTTEEALGDGTMLVGEIAEDGAAITVASAGLYHVMLDLPSATIYVVKIEKFGLIGPAGPGWSTDAEIPLKSASATEVVFEGTNIEVRNDEFKFRYNSNWNSDRTSATPAVDGLNLLTNFGTVAASTDENGAFQPGGFNFNFGGQEGAYTVTLTFTPGKGIVGSANFERTGDVQPITFDPDSNQWAVIGSATPNGWDGPDHDFDYKGKDGDTYTWIRTLSLLPDSAFKIRTNDSWDVNRGAGNLTITGTAAGLMGGSDNIEVGATDKQFYLLTLTTDDEGDTYTLQVDSLSWGIIGNATPGGWDNSTMMTYDGDATWTLNVQIESGTDGSGNPFEYKFRVNNAWDYNIGGELANLVRDGGNLSVGATGTYDVTLTATDGGDSYSATVQ